MTEGSASRGPDVYIHTAPASGFYPPPETCRLQRCTTHAHVYCFKNIFLLWPSRCLRHGVARTVSCRVFCVLSKSSRYHGCRPRATALSAFVPVRHCSCGFVRGKKPSRRASVRYNGNGPDSFISVTQYSCFVYSIAASSPCMRDPCVELLVFHVTHGTRNYVNHIVRHSAPNWANNTLSADGHYTIVNACGWCLEM
jgi:hypothetical protein